MNGFKPWVQIITSKERLQWDGQVTLSQITKNSMEQSMHTWAPMDLMVKQTSSCIMQLLTTSLFQEMRIISILIIGQIEAKINTSMVQSWFLMSEVMMSLDSQVELILEPTMRSINGLRMACLGNQETYLLTILQCRLTVGC